MDRRKFLGLFGVSAAGLFGIANSKRPYITATGARVYNSTPITIANGAFTVLPFDSEVFDYGGCHDSAHPERLTAPVDGLYLLTGQVVWDANPAGIREMYIYVNGQTYHAGRSVYEPEGFNYVAHQCTAVVWMAAGQYATLHVVQTTGGDLDITAVDPSSPVFSIAHLK